MWFIIGFVVWFILWFIWHATYIPYPSTYALYFGPPRCGKTTFLTRIAKKYSKSRDVFTNYPVTGIDHVYRFCKDDIAKYDFGPHALMIFDEASLDGFDNRDFKSNFKDPALLEKCKTIGHYQNSMCLGNQGWDECDKKIKTLTTQYWLVKRLPLISLAIRVKMNTKVRDDTQQPGDVYSMPSLLSILFLRRSLQICIRPLYYKYFDSWEKKELPPIPKVKWLRKVDNS